MKRFTLFVLVLLLLVAFTAIALFLDSWIIQSRNGPLHTYELNDPPDFLTDDLALSKAREAMEQDGYGGPLWRPIEDDCTASPDGIPDKYLNRNTLNPNEGSILFSTN